MSPVSATIVVMVRNWSSLLGMAGLRKSRVEYGARRGAAARAASCGGPFNSPSPSARESREGGLRRRNGSWRCGGRRPPGAAPRPPPTPTRRRCGRRNGGGGRRRIDVAAGVDARHRVGVLRPRRRHLRADRMQHVGRVGVGAVVDEAVGEIGEVVDLGAERLEPLAVLGLRRVDRADPLARLGDGAGERQRAIVGGGEDGDVCRSQPRHLPGEDVHIDVGRGEHDVAEMAGEVAIAGDRLLAQRLHRQPAAHRMGEHVHFADARASR